MRLFAKDFYRSLLLGFAIGSIGMGATIAVKVHASEAAAPSAMGQGQ
ncbi:hypothetical protein [Novosphingobium olei]|nr:hypothetical protein [Novosphingobium olei]BEV02460.1 hypothetical protein NSDW_35540 [Novosphingobium olei]